MNDGALSTNTCGETVAAVAASVLHIRGFSLASSKASSFTAAEWSPRSDAVLRFHGSPGQLVTPHYMKWVGECKSLVAVNLTEVRLGVCF